MSRSNNAPAVSLELDADTARFLLKNCDQNLMMGLGLMMAPTISRESAERLVEMNEHFKTIRDKLKAQGVKSDE